MAQYNYLGGPIYNKVPNASVPDVTPPTFAGLSSATAGNNGDIVVAWSPATDATPPIRYNIYITAGASINYSNLLCSAAASPFNIFQDSAGNLLAFNQQYTVAVRAVDAVGNIDSNVVTASATSLGVAPDSIYNLVTVVKGLVIAGL